MIKFIGFIGYLSAVYRFGCFPISEKNIWATMFFTQLDEVAGVGHNMMANRQRRPALVSVPQLYILSDMRKVCIDCVSDVYVLVCQ